MGKRLMASFLSGAILLAALGSLSLQGLNLGLDFTGGSLVEVKLAEKVAPQTVRGFLVDAGFTNGTVQTFGSDEDLLIRVPPQQGVEGASQANLGDEIFTALSAQYPGGAAAVSYVGTVGDELAEDGGLALLTALLVVMIYILFRFTKQFSVGAVVALAHDVVIVLGCFGFRWTLISRYSRRYWR